MNKIDEIVERVLSDSANHGCSYNGIRTIQVTVEEFRGFLQEVVEPFAKDAERYRFVRDATDDVVDQSGICLIANSSMFGSGDLTGDQWDEAIDTAIASAEGK